MTGHLDEAALMTKPLAEIGQLRSRSMLFGGIGLILTIAGYFVAPDVFWQSYLIAFMFWIGLTIGSMAVLMVQYLSGGAWGLVGRRIFEASSRTLPLMAALFVPIYLKLDTLYVWARPEAAADEIIHEKAAYLNAPFFGLRAVIFFALWGGLIFLLNKWSKEQDENPALLPGPQDRRFRVLSGPGLVIYVLTITFASVDWVMSLDPHWFSTIFGVLTLGGQGLATLAFTILVLASLVRFSPMSQVADAEKFHDLSKLMFAFVMLWAYFSVSQLIIIWSGNLPEEIPFYLERLHGPWYPISVGLLLFQFALPFLLLLSRNFKRNPRAVARIAALILLMRVVDIAWTIGPAFRGEGSGLHWLDFAAVLGMGFFWLAFFWSNLAGRSLVPARDPYFKEAMAHGGH
ncbi:MAG: hypothetical protein R2752_17510 [Vicinamibacterales bacterium]